MHEPLGMIDEMAVVEESGALFSVGERYLRSFEHPALMGKICIIEFEPHGCFRRIRAPWCVTG